MSSKAHPLALAPLLLGFLSLTACGGDPDAAGSTGQGGSITGSGGASSTASASASGSGGASSSTASASSVTASASGSGGGGGAGGSGVGGGEPCANTDPGEPNETEAQAYDLGTIGCSDSDPGMIYGVLAGPDDTDWFAYHGLDEVSCSVNPTSGVTITPGTARVCAYFACLSGPMTTDPGSCPAGTIKDTSPDGRPGCCGTSDFSVGLNCTGTINDEAFVYLRVDDPIKAAVCGSYSVAFHY